MLNNVLKTALSKRVSVMVVGDKLLDEYVTGSVSRVSPEAPVPVFAQGHQCRAPGGALNVAHQLALWNCEIVEPAPLCDGAYSAFSFPSHPDIREKKVRFMDGDRQVFRSDSGVRSLAPVNIVELCLKAQCCHALVISDYAKGAFTEQEIERLRHVNFGRKLPVVIDTKRPELWKGVGITKCTERDAKGRSAQVVTRSGKPPLVDGIPVGKEIFSVPVKSVVGAGDCFAAVLARMLAGDASVRDAAAIAHEAGAVYVQYLYNRPVHPWQVLQRLDWYDSRIVRAAAVRSIVGPVFDTARIVFTNGCFDFLHDGHVATLEWAKKQGGILVVGVNDDDSVRRLKGNNRPMLPQMSRMLLVAGLGCVDFVVPFYGDTPIDAIRAIRPDIIVKGPDYAGIEVVGREICPDVRIAKIELSGKHSSDLCRTQWAWHQYSDLPEGGIGHGEER